MTFEEQLKIADGSRFQEKLYDLVKEKRPNVIVEIGRGVSSIFILKALDDANIDGKLHSIDIGQWYPHKIEHPKFNEINKDSIDALLDLYYQVGPFDLVCDDGNHEVKHTTYEYNFCFDCLKPGGIIVADDTTWNGHGAWQQFCKERDLIPYNMGDTQVIQKPLHKPFVPASEAKLRHRTYLAVAEEREKEWLAAGGIKHEAFR